MKRWFTEPNCPSCPLSRRHFLGRCAACAGSLGLLSSPSWVRAMGAADRLRLRILYSLHAPQQPGPDWPNVGFDFQPVMDRVHAQLSRECPEFDFVSSPATGPEQAEAILKEDQTQQIDGYIVYQMNCWNRVVQTIAASGKPVLYVDFQYGGSGGFLVYNAAFLRSSAANVGFVASSRPSDLVAAVKSFKIIAQGGSASDFVAATARARQRNTPRASARDWETDPLNTLDTKDCVQRMHASKILAVRDQNSGPADPIMGIPLEGVSFKEVNDAWTTADAEETRSVANRWETNAALVEGVSRETLEQSAAMYLAMKTVLKNHDANAITINCLGGFYGGHIHAYPCLGFHELLNEGLVGACECDVRSTATMVAMTALTQGRPGYISDPVIDTAKRQIIYAHCVASNRPFGPTGRTNPYQILTHSEDRQGASVRSVLPVGYLTTTMEIDQGKRQILFHQGKAVDNDPDDRACRTKLCAEPVGDIEKLFSQWDQWGWHRVTFYGDLKQPVYALAGEIGWQVVEEA